jgi:N utilization substance protein A
VDTTTLNAGLFDWLWLDVISEGDVAGTTADEDDVELNFQMKSTGLLKNLQNWFGYCKSILKQDVEDLVRRTDLEEETILDVMKY